MARLSIILFGSFHVTLDGVPVTGFESNKVRALLALLAVEADRPHSRDSVIGLLWPDQDERTARRNLSQALFNLRQAIGDDESTCFLLINRETIQFNLASDYWLDVGVFEGHLSASQTQSRLNLETCQEVAPNLEQAEALYQGEFLTGFFVSDSAPFSEWATLHRERYHRLILDALSYLARYYEQHRDYARACHYARRQTELEPWREEAHQQLIRLLARSGQRSAALHQYEQCRCALRDELGVTPQNETIALYERIRVSGSTRSHNLPAPLTPFIGRKTQLSQIVAHLENPDCRLLTLIGPGGIGKTRLALQAGHELPDRFINGVWFIPLSAVPSIEFFVSTVADVLRLHFSGSRQPAEQLMDYLQNKEMLLIMDSLEHLQGVAELLAKTLQKAPFVKILATSRERLNLQAEWLVDVQGLTYPQREAPVNIEDFEAVQLFLQNARRVSAGFTLSDENRTPIVRICQLLEGVPLGIELASPWVRTLSCEQVFQSIQRDTDFLTTSLRDVPSRHQSLRAVFQHSWGLLSDAEREGAARVSVFRSPFRLESAQAVTGIGPEVIQGLTDKSFLNQNQSGRIEFHGLLKQYLAEMLAALPQAERQVREAHGLYYAAFLDQHARDLRGWKQTQAQAEIQAEIEDVRAAWDWALRNLQVDAIERSLEGLYLYFRGQGHFQEGQEAFNRAVQAVRASGEPGCFLLAKLQSRQADFLAWLGDYDLARGLLRESLATFEAQQVQHEQAFAQDVWGRIALWSGEYNEALETLQASTALYRQSGDSWGTAQALNYWANTICYLQSDLTKAAPLYEESLALSRQSGDQAGIARALVNLAANEQVQKKYAKARTLYQEAMTISQAIGNRQILAIALGNLGDVAYYCGEYDQALELLLDSLAIKRETGNRYSMLLTMNNLGKANLPIGQLHEARRWYIQALQIAQELKSQVAMAIIVNSIAGLLVKEGNACRAAELLQVALDHAGGDQDVVTSVTKICAEVEALLGAQTTATCRERGRGELLETVVAKLLAGG
jgi:DNA-binding SARP family transcriptional activator